MYKCITVYYHLKIRYRVPIHHGSSIPYPLTLDRYIRSDKVKRVMKLGRGLNSKTRPVKSRGPLDILYITGNLHEMSV